MTIYLAPMQGLTDYRFRNAFFAHYSGIDVAVSPFLSLSGEHTVNPSRLTEVLPQNNPQHPLLIPQILGNNPAQLPHMAQALADLGYTELNWNLGCPMPAITHKKRGSGLLPYPEIIDRFLNESIGNIPQQLSIKMRLGLHHTDEGFRVAEVLNRYPIAHVCIHPRLGDQRYEGTPNLEAFAALAQTLHFPIVYNGDIYSPADLQRIQQLFPDLAGVMIGRGLLCNLTLAEQLKETLSTPDKQRFWNFHDDLLRIWQSEKSNHTTLGKMKEYWKYFATYLSLPDAILRSLLQKQTLADLLETIQPLR